MNLSIALKHVIAKCRDGLSDESYHCFHPKLKTTGTVALYGQLEFCESNFQVRIFFVGTIPVFFSPLINRIIYHPLLYRPASR